MARPTKLTPETQERIITAIRAGNYQDTAARWAGIDPSTFYRWMELGAEEDAEDLYSEFREAVENAKAAAEVRDVALIDKAAQDGTWQAAAWKLERKFPHRWGRINRTEVSGPEGSPITMEIDAKTELKKLLGLVVDADTEL